MAATAMASSFSTSIQNLNCSRPKNRATASDQLPRLHVSIKASSQIPLSLQSHFLGMVRCLFTPAAAVSPKRRVSRLAVAEEAAATGTEEEEEEEGEEEQEEEVDGEEAASTGTEEESAIQNLKLYFGNLPYNCDSAQLAGVVQEYGSPELVEVLYERETGKSRGYAFVTMSSIEDCHAVIQNLDRTELGGRIMRVNFSNRPQPKDPLYPESDHKLFVGNLSWTVTSEILSAAFEKHGNVVGARVLYDGQTGRSRGYGFVSYETQEEMENALSSMNGAELEGRALRVFLAEGKKE
ncbi:unnamed protein product [Cuscuta europaea]|uniref:RRM domain-containing protein n=1 Tax=Cuscuta europaea TaxID=41803 RepID=A0A9P0ZHY0_CUSEU|nr:unnamed protein product [Cuscuta europaea]